MSIEVMESPRLLLKKLISEKLGLGFQSCSLEGAVEAVGIQLQIVMYMKIYIPLILLQV